jgi:transcription antitermination factor NusG
VSGRQINGISVTPTEAIVYQALGANEVTKTIESGWHIIRCQPNMEIIASIGLNVRGFEAYCPAEYRLASTNKMENGRRVKVLRPRAMITGYAFIRFEAENWDFEGVRRVKGVGDFMRINGEPAGLTEAEIQRLRAVDAEEFAKYQRAEARRAAEDAMRALGKPTVPFEEGKQVIVDGPTGERWLVTMLQERGARRVQVMKDNAKIIVDHSRIHEVA